jgi:hypothetical protein
MNLEEAILDKVRHLPPAMQQEVLRYADGLQRQTNIGPGPSRDRALERIWIDQNRATFAGQWVAVEGDRLLASGMDAQEVYAAAKAQGIQSPFVVHILADDPLPFVPGW